MNKQNIISILGCSFLVTTILLLSTNSNIAFSQQEQAQASQPHDSVTVLMEGKTIPGRNFIHLYDSTPSSISSGHVAGSSSL